MAKERAARYQDVVICLGKTLTESLLVQQPSRQLYSWLLTCLASFILGHSTLPTLPATFVTMKVACATLDALSDDELDCEATEYIDWCFRAGESGQLGHKVVASLAW